MTQAKSPYSPGFFTGNARNSMKSAGPVLQILRDLYAPTSIVDIGCGSGAWLATAETLGFTVLRGYDGPWADPARYTSPSIDFIPVDMEKNSFEHDRRYDLAMSVEVAEHLSESRADFIVDKLCEASDVVLFSAALPYQGGVHHIHERPLTYWMAKFRDRGYEPFDIIRPTVWDNDDVQWWFRQNAVLYVKQSSTVLDPAKLHAMETRVWDIVHPASFVARTTKMRKQVRELKAERDKLKQRVADLERATDALRAPRGLSQRLRTVGAGELPQPLQAPATAVWRKLPPSVRDRLRPKR